MSGMMNKYINSKVKVSLKDSGTFVGIFKGYDEFMNIVLFDCEEIKVNSSTGRAEKRILGMVVVRGSNVISVVEVGRPLEYRNIARAPRRSSYGERDARERREDRSEDRRGDRREDRREDRPRSSVDSNDRYRR